ncbi:MAG: ATP synthase F1 subunit gamma [Crocinitomicaceae bacterium]|nr:ATP synthase F1 subunit gamma [Crocinitomicaceae bacterium]
MANLKEIRNRITSVSSTMQITSAMKMVSAAKLKRAQDAVTQMRPYANKLGEILANLSSTLDGEENAYSTEREVKNVLIVPITSNRGLCGGFNNNVIKKTLAVIKEDYTDKNVSVLCIGKKADDSFKRTQYNIKGTFLPKNLNDVWGDLTFDHVAPIAEKIMNAYTEGHIDKIVLVYNEFVSVSTQPVKVEQYLPLVQNEVEETEGANANLDYIFEPNKEDIVTELIPKTLKIQLYSALLDSNAGEHGARMTAMHKATDNAGELQKSLKLEYNKARQAAITNEILEIVGGAEALNN